MAVVSTLQRTYSTFLVDISATGVRLRGNDLPDEGEESIVNIESVRTYGCIAWKGERECGIAFEEPLHPGDVLTIKLKASKGGRYAPELRAAFDDWTLGFAR